MIPYNVVSALGLLFRFDCLTFRVFVGVVGRPGIDFPVLASIPRTDFSCRKAKKPGYYADPETDCQVIIHLGCFCFLYL